VHRYTRAEIRFLEKKITGRTIAELTELFNRRFGLAQTETAIAWAAYSRGLANGLRDHAHRYTPVQIRFLERKIPGRPFAETARIFNEHFNLTLSEKSIISFARNHKLRNGRDCRFRPGQISHNKGKKGVSYPGMEATQFKPGFMPWNYNPPGTERINTEGYVDVKIANPNKWKQKHLLIWEAAHGKVPEGYKIMFADGNRLNVTLDNLLMVSQAELSVMNKCGLISPHKDLTKTGRLVADIKMLISQRKKSLKKKRSKRTSRK
jgi:hypothetical protein